MEHISQVERQLCDIVIFGGSHFGKQLLRVVGFLGLKFILEADLGSVGFERMLMSGAMTYLVTSIVPSAVSQGPNHTELTNPKHRFPGRLGESIRYFRNLKP